MLDFLDVPSIYSTFPFVFVVCFILIQVGRFIVRELDIYDTLDYNGDRVGNLRLHSSLQTSSGDMSRRR